MSQQDDNSKFPPQIIMILALGCLIASIYLFSLQDLDDALRYFIIATLCILLGWWRIRVNHPEQWLINLVGFFVIIGLSTIIANSKSNKMNQAAPKKTICGKVESIYTPQGRGISTFTLLNSHQNERMTFPYHRHREQLEEFKGKDICIDYSFASKWADYGYIDQIIELKNN